MKSSQSHRGVQPVVVVCQLVADPAELGLCRQALHDAPGPRRRQARAMKSHRADQRQQARGDE
eukprot:5804104-Lingulodinium_polyedra.AAC.1